MSEKCKGPKYLEVAEDVTKFITEKYGESVIDPQVLEGMWLAMQMVGGPEAAARTISYCSVKVD